MSQTPAFFVILALTNVTGRTGGCEQATPGSRWIAFASKHELTHIWSSWRRLEAGPSQSSKNIGFVSFARGGAAWCSGIRTDAVYRVLEDYIRDRLSTLISGDPYPTACRSASVGSLRSLGQVPGKYVRDIVESRDYAVKPRTVRVTCRFITRRSLHTENYQPPGGIWFLSS